MVKSACGIEAVYMCFNGTGIWGGETIYVPIKCSEYMALVTASRVGYSQKRCYVITGQHLLRDSY